MAADNAQEISAADSRGRHRPDAEATVPGPVRQSGRWWLQHLVTILIVIGGVVLLIASLGVAQRLGWISGGGVQPVSESQATAIHTCPMHPQIRQPGPGNCPICGMALVPATGGEADLDELAVTIQPAARRLAGITTVEVRREPIATTVETIGGIAIDESRMSTISSYIDGRIEQLFADYTGVRVAEGDHLAVVYSPELYSAQIEYLESRKAVSGGTSSLEAVRQAQSRLAANSRQRLVELGVTEQQISELEESETANSRLTIFSPVGGTVIEKMAMEGKYVKAGEPIYRIADLSTVWLMLELYPEDASRIRFGQRVEADMQSVPGETFVGRVAFIDPTVDAADRTVGVRVEFSNDDGRLRPGDYASAKIYLPIGQQGDVYDSDLAGRWISPMHPQIIRDEAGTCPICGMDLVPTSRYGYSEQPVQQPESLFIPRSALLMAGDNSVVYVETQPGRFELRPVTLGAVLKDRVVILEGLQAGETVAAAGNFLIDSQMQLAGKPSLIDPTRALAAKPDREGPLSISQVDVEPVSGETGQKLEELYAAYFAVQAQLAGDQKPETDSAMTLHQLSSGLAESPELSESVRELLKVIAENSEHLHHLPIDAARLDAFRPISQAIVRLASVVRGDAARQPFVQMYCPMVKGGGGDWLQVETTLRNPYWGSQMLTCGDVIRQFPANGQEPGGPDDDSSSAAEKE